MGEAGSEPPATASERSAYRSGGGRDGDLSIY